MECRHTGRCQRLENHRGFFVRDVDARTGDTSISPTILTGTPQALVSRPYVKQSSEERHP